MNTYFQQIVAALLPLASEHTPESSDPVAVAHQWAHALANGHPLYGARRGITKKKITGVLKKAGLYSDADSLQTKLPKTPVKPPKESTFTFIDLFAGISNMRTDLRAESAYLYLEALTRGGFERGEAQRITGLAERTARDVLSSLTKEGFLLSDTPKGRVRAGFPVKALGTFLPNLYPAGDVDFAD